MNCPEFSLLVKDTLTFLQESQEIFTFSSEEDCAFFADTPPLPKHPSKEILPPSSPLPSAEKKTLKTPPVEPQEIPKKAPLPASPPLPIEALLKKVAPEIKIEISPTVLEPHVLLLTFSPTAEELSFYKNLAKAIQTHLKPIKLLVGDAYERENKWPSLFESKRYPLILAPHSITTCKNLTPFYQKETLAQSPLLLLASSYSQEQKALLWKNIQAALLSS